jgi:predicted secreted protein
MYKAKEILQLLEDLPVLTDNVLYGRTGKFVKVTLPVNPASGYDWVPVYDSSYLSLVSKDLINRSSEPWSGKYVFTFRAEKAGVTSIEMNLRSGGSIQDTETYQIEIYDTENTDQLDRLEKRFPYS